MGSQNKMVQQMAVERQERVGESRVQETRPDGVKVVCARHYVIITSQEIKSSRDLNFTNSSTYLRPERHFVKLLASIAPNCVDAVHLIF